MKNNSVFGILAALIMLGSVGCTALTHTISQVPVVTTSPTGQTITNYETLTNTVYVPAPAIAATQAKVDAGIQAVSPVVSVLAPPIAPAVPLVQPVVDGIFGLIAGLSTLVAYLKNKSANDHAAAAAALAAAVVGSPNLAPVALANAASNGSSATVAVHLANAVKPV